MDMKQVRERIWKRRRDKISTIEQWDDAYKAGELIKSIVSIHVKKHRKWSDKEKKRVGQTVNQNVNRWVYDY